jgi:hypothetical protein
MLQTIKRPLALIVAVILFFVSGPRPVAPIATASGCAGTLTSCITHVVVIIQENRSFNNLFYNFPGATTSGTCHDHQGNTVALTNSGSLTAAVSPGHQWEDGLGDEYSSWFNAGEPVGGALGTLDNHGWNPNHCTYVPSGSILQYWTLAQDYTLADNFFQGNLGPSFEGHQELAAGTTDVSDTASTYCYGASPISGNCIFAVDNPTSGNSGGCGVNNACTSGGCDSGYGAQSESVDNSSYGSGFAPGTLYQYYPCFPRITIFDELLASSIPFMHYQQGSGAQFWHSMDADQGLYCYGASGTPSYTEGVADYLSHCATTVASPNPSPATPTPACIPAQPYCVGTGPKSTYLAHVNATVGGGPWGPEKNNIQIFSDITNGVLPTVSYVVPSSASSDHPTLNDNTGPSWVASVVNAIGQSAYWQNTAIFVTWDDWGGFYDPVTPTPINIAEPGFRVPLLIISPYALAGNVDHTYATFSGILRFIEEVACVNPLGTTDSPTYTSDLTEAFNFAQTPLTFTPIGVAPAPVWFGYAPHKWIKKTIPMDQWYFKHVQMPPEPCSLPDEDSCVTYAQKRAFRAYVKWAHGIHRVIAY